MAIGLLDEDFGSYVVAYSDYLRLYRGLSEATMRTYTQDLSTFVDFLNTMKIDKFDSVDRRVVELF